jgi:hypothetical protein
MSRFIKYFYLGSRPSVSVYSTLLWNHSPQYISPPLRLANATPYLIWMRIGLCYSYQSFRLDWAKYRSSE